MDSQRQKQGDSKGNRARRTHLGIAVDLQPSCARIESRNLRNVVVLPLTLFFLEFEGDTTDGSFLDTLHQVSREAGDLVAQALGRDDGLQESQYFGLGVH